MLDCLNSDSPFDFAYIPEEGDALVIYSVSLDGNFLQFTYGNGRWEVLQFWVSIHHTLLGDGFVILTER